MRNSIKPVGQKSIFRNPVRIGVDQYGAQNLTPTSNSTYMMSRAALASEKSSVRRRALEQDWTF